MRLSVFIFDQYIGVQNKEHFKYPKWRSMPYKNVLPFDACTYMLMHSSNRY